MKIYFHIAYKLYENAKTCYICEEKFENKF